MSSAHAPALGHWSLIMGFSDSASQALLPTTHIIPLPLYLSTPTPRGHSQECNGMQYEKETCLILIKVEADKLPISAKAALLPNSGTQVRSGAMVNGRVPCWASWQGTG